MHAGSLLGAGDAYVKLNDLPSAENFLRRAIDADPKAAKYLTEGVDEFHDQAFDQESNSALLYRNALFDLISAKAAKAGREDANRALSELKLRSGFGDEDCFQLRKRN